jgi:hypothetical protein
MSNGNLSKFNNRIFKEQMKMKVANKDKMNNSYKEGTKQKKLAQEKGVKLCSLCQDG